MKTQRSVQMLLAVTVLVLASLACTLMGGAAPTQPPAPPPPTQQVNPPVVEPPTTAPPVPQDTPTAEPPPPTPTEEVQQFFTEEFDVDSGNWSERVEKNADEGDLSKAQISLHDGFLSFDLGKWLIAYKFYEPYEYSDVRIDVRVDNRGTNVNDILLVCRASEEGLYLVNIANSGLFAMYAYDGAKDSYTRMADGGSNKIRPGKEVNEYSLLCSDNKLTLYINGFETRQYTDNQFAFRKGKIGIGIASENQVPVKVDFDWVKISQP